MLLGISSSERRNLMNEAVRRKGNCFLARTGFLRRVFVFLGDAADAGSAGAILWRFDFCCVCDFHGPRSWPE
ncbi:hypothetical protein LF1_08780 [Rubripirellula obstinata]|uniref:Uncharacterized protein n=1 Tax=Rubripirellula obstinata TaxID=406547 RepID=A0A5B1CFM0_9BACT|nr:hypothetical protein LF1_08780 [Rubripirellula obstinata]